jgi:SAM-dependent methyltransferase
MSDAVSLPRAMFDRVARPPFVAGRELVTRALERRAGISTQARVSLRELGLDDEHREGYEPSRWLTLRRALRPGEVTPDDVFADLGSGMGRIVYQAAAHYRFRRVIGVEIAEQLHAIALENIGRNRARLRCDDVQLVCCDVVDYDIPDDVTVVYMSNPFSGPVFQAALDALAASLRRNPRRLRLLYTDPVEEAAVLRAGFRLTRIVRGRRPGAQWSRSNSTCGYELDPRGSRRHENREHWESIGAAYTDEWDPPARSRLGERELEFILDGLRASGGRTALDVGIGSGRILDGLVRGTSDTQFWGLDIARAMVDASRERLAEEPRVRDLRICDVAREPLPFDQRFDFISAIRMLKYNANWQEIVAKLVAQLVPGGVIVFTISNARSLNAVSRPYAIEGFDVTRAEARRLCDELGLEVLAEQGFTKLPHMVRSGVRSRAATLAVLGVDALLERLVGGPALAREVFITARRS